MALKQAPDALYKAYRSEPGLRPVAHPVDTFVRTFPDQNAGSELLQLADALKGLQPKLGAYFDAKREEATEAETAAGIKAYEENRKNWAEYLKEHPEHAGFSPHFQKGYRSMWLREQARRMSQEKRDAYDKGITVDVSGKQVDIREVEDAQAFENWNGTYNQDWIKANLGDIDPKEFAEHFLPVINQYDSQLTQLHIAQRAAAYKEGYANAYSNEIMGAVMEASKDPLFDTPEGKLQIIGKLGQLITNKTTEAMADGMTALQANDLAVGSVIDAAKAVGGFDGLDLLEALGHAKAGTGALGGIGKYKVAIQEAKDAIETNYMAMESKRWQYEKLKKEKAADVVMQNYYAAMWENPGKNWDAEIAAVSKVSWEAGEAMRSHLESIRSSHELDSRGKPKKSGGGTGASDYLGLELLNLETLTEEGILSPAEAEKALQGLAASNAWGIKDQKALHSTLKAIRKGTKSTLNSVMTQVDPLLKRTYIGNDMFSDGTSPESVMRYREARAAMVSEMLKHIQNTGENDPVNLAMKADEVLKKIYKYFPTDTTQKADAAGFKTPPPIISRTTNISSLVKPPSKFPGKIDMAAGHFSSTRNYLETVKSWKVNPFDPANPINVAAKRLGMEPRTYVLQQGQFYFGPDGKSMTERLNTEL